MSITLEPVVAGSPRGLALLNALWRRLAQSLAGSAENLEIVLALRTLSQLDERELNDMGLSRSELTPEGLASAAARRARKQAAVNAETAAKRQAAEQQKSPRRI